MTLQTWIIHLGWAIQNLAGIIVLCEICSLKYRKVYVIPSYVLGIVLLHVARYYTFICSPDFPTHTVFIGFLVPLFIFLFMRVVSTDKTVITVFWVALIYACSTLAAILAFIVYFMIFGEYVYFDFVSTQSMYGNIITTIIMVIMFLSFLFVWKQFIGGIRSDIPNINVFVFVICGQLVYSLYQVNTLLSSHMEVDPWAAIGLIMLIIGNIVILQVILTNSKKKETEDKLNELQYLRERELVYYASVESRRQELVKIRHDFNNHIVAAHHLIETSEMEHAEKILNELRHSLDATTKYAYCNNVIVNAVLTEKQKECILADIILEANIFIDEMCDISPMHLCSIFSNLLDNAISACKSLPEKMRKIEIRTAIKGAYLHIKSVNPIAESTKINGNGRKGYGQVILSDIASIYKGNFTTDISNGIYTAMISLPV